MQSPEGAGPHYLINPFGLHYAEVMADNLVKIDVDGRDIDGSPHGVHLATSGRRGWVQLRRPAVAEGG